MDLQRPVLFLRPLLDLAQECHRQQALWWRYWLWSLAHHLGLDRRQWICWIASHSSLSRYRQRAHRYHLLLCVPLHGHPLQRSFLLGLLPRSITKLLRQQRSPLQRQPYSRRQVPIQRDCLPGVLACIPAYTVHRCLWRLICRCCRRSCSRWFVPWQRDLGSVQDGPSSGG